VQIVLPQSRRLIDAVDHYQAYLHSQQRIQVPGVTRLSREDAQEAIMRTVVVLGISPEFP